MDDKVYMQLQKTELAFLDSAIKTLEARLQDLPKKWQDEILGKTDNDAMPFAALNELYEVRAAKRQAIEEEILTSV